MILRPLLQREYVGGSDARAVRRLPGARVAVGPFVRESEERAFWGQLRVRGFHLRGVDELWTEETGCPCAVRFPEADWRGMVAVADEHGDLVLRSNREKPEDDVRTCARAHAFAVEDLCWLGGSSQIVTASRDRSLRLWDAATMSFLQTFGVHPGACKSVRSFGEDPNLFLSCCTGGLVLMWDKRLPSSDEHKGPLSEKCIPPFREFDDLHCAAPEKRSGMRQPHALSAVAPTRDGRLFATATAHGEIKFWDIRISGRRQDPLQFIPCSPAIEKTKWRPGITSIDFDPVGSKLLVTYKDNHHVVFEWMHYQDKLRSPDHFKTFGGSLQLPFKTESSHIRSSFSPDGNFFVSGNSPHLNNSRGLIWDVYARVGEPTTYLQWHEYESTSVHWNPCDFNWIAMAGNDLTMTTWKVNEAGLFSNSNFRSEKLQEMQLQTRGKSYVQSGNSLNKVAQKGMRIWTPAPRPRSARTRATGENNHQDGNTPFATSKKRKATILDHWGTPRAGTPPNLKLARK